MTTTTTTTTRYYLTIDGEPTIGWPKTFASEGEAREAAEQAHVEGRTVDVAPVPDDWRLTADREIGWLVGGPEGLAYIRAFAARGRA